MNSDQPNNTHCGAKLADVSKISRKHNGSPKVISVTSGKGGVGKTLTTVNLAVAARNQGLSVLILDGDLGLANVDVVLGLQTRYNLRDVFDGQVSLADIIVSGPMDIRVIPSGSGIASLTQLSYVQKHQLLAGIDELGDEFDMIIVDTGAGISDNVVHFNGAAEQILVVTTPEPHAMTDAYALIKVLKEQRDIDNFSLVVNQTKAPGEGLKVSERIAEVADRFLQVKVEYVGDIPFDPQVSKSVMQRRAATKSTTHTIAGQAWNRIARELFSNIPQRSQEDAQGVWKKLLWSEERSTAAGF